jgi:hypothetical protein
MVLEVRGVAWLSRLCKASGASGASIEPVEGCSSTQLPASHETMPVEHGRSSSVCRLTWTGRVTLASPVPSHAGHLISVTTSFGLGLFIKIVSEIKKDTHANFTGIRSTRFISLCKIEVVRPSSQSMVTPLQVVSTTVPRSVVVAPQRTRSNGLRSLDWSPVIDARH